MKKTGTKKWFRIWIGSMGVMVLLFMFAHFFLSRYVPSLIRNKINHLVVDGSDSLYTCSIGQVSFNIWQGKVTIDNLLIQIDSAKYKERKAIGKLPPMTFDIHLSKGSITGLQIFSLIFHKKINIHTIRADEANISLCRQYKEVKKKPVPTEESLWKILRPHIMGIYVDRILLDKIKFTYWYSEDKEDISFAYENCSANLEHIRIDSIGSANSSRILFTEDIAVKFIGVNYFTPDSIYNLTIDTLAYSSFLQKFQVKNFRMDPLMSMEEITRRHGMQLDVFKTDIPDLMGINFKIEKIFTENELCFDTIVVKKAYVNICRDRTAHQDSSSQLGKYPIEVLLKAPLAIRVPLIVLDDAEIHYIERQKLSLQKGDAFFTHVTGTVSNITNHLGDIEKDNHLKIDLHGFFLKNAPLKVKFDFDLASAEGKFTGSADLGAMKVEELNTVLIPFGNVYMKSLDIHEGHFRLSGDNKGVTSTVRLLYEKMNIQILKVDPKTHEAKEQPFVTFFTNLTAIRTSNRVGDKEVIGENIYVVRKRRQPFSNLVWEAFFEGSKKVVLKVPAKDLKVEM